MSEDLVSRLKYGALTISEVENLLWDDIRTKVNVWVAKMVRFPSFQ